MSTGPESLARDTILVRAPELFVRLSDDGSVRIELDDSSVTVAAVGLEVLVAFEHPTTVGDVLDRLGAQSMHRFIAASEAALQLHRAGALVHPGEPRRARGHGFAASGIHVSMLRDAGRTRAFCDALAAVVTSSDVVVDIGTGTGILATRAAQLGARHAYAIEATGIADVAERVVAANGVADRVTVVRGHSADVSLPERATVLVTEIIGDDPLDEDLLSIVLDARERLLSEQCTLVPSRIELIAVPVALTEEILARHTMTPTTVAACRQAYGVDLTPLLERGGATLGSVMLGATELAALERVGPPTVVADIDLATVTAPSVRASAELSLTRDAPVLGIALTFRATLADGIVLSPLVPELDRDTHWKTHVWLAARDLATPAGTKLRVDYAHRRQGSDVQIHFLP